jgi:hypothetical protein
LSKHKYELLDAPEETPKQAPQVKNEAAEPVEKEQQHSVGLISDDATPPESETTTTEESKPKRGRKPKQA